MTITFDARQLEKLKQRYLEGGIDRRSFLGIIGLAGVAAGVAGGPLRAFAQAANVSELKYHGWGGAVQEALRKTAFDAYEKASGVKVVEGTFGLEEEILTQARVGREGDYHIINSAGIAWYKRWVDAGFGVVLNEANIPNLQHVMTALIEPFRKVTPEGLSAVPFSYGNTAIAYNKKYIPQEEAEAKREMLLIDPALKGKLSGHNDFQTRMWAAALQTKQDPNNMQDLDAIWEKIRENRALVKKYWGSGAESVELLANEEVYAADIWSGRAAGLMERNPDIGYVEYSTGYCWASDLLVVKGAPLEACEQFLNFILDPEVMIVVAEAQLYPPPMDPTKVELSDKIKSLPNFDPTGTLSHLAFSDPAYWTEHERDWKQMYSRIERGF